MADVLDIFNQDAFNMVSLTNAVNNMDFKPNRLGELGVFQEEGIPTVTVVLEEDNQTLTLVPLSRRGGPGEQTAKDKRKARSFVIPHISLDDSVIADEVQGVRGYANGMMPSQQLVAVQDIVNRKLAKLRNRIDVTLEYHRMGALQGSIMDADGKTVIYDLFREFGVEQQDFNMALDTAQTNVLGKIRAVQRLSLTALKSIVVNGWRALCGDSFFDKLVGHAKVEDKYLNFQAVTSLRDESLAYSTFNFGGVMWENYRGLIGSVNFIGDTNAFLYPAVAVGDTYKGYFAPSDYIDRVNQGMPPNGLPMEARQELMLMGKGIKIEVQSNPLYLCTRPRAVIKLNENN